MSNRRARKKLQRAAYGPGGSLMYVPPMTQQGVLGQTFYGNKLNIPVQQAALFSPGQPLPPQQGVNPGGQPVAFRFPISYNTYPVDRSLGSPDIPSFEQLRRLAKMYSGITLCERYWLDLVPRMKLLIGLKKEYKDDGAEEKDYQKEIKFFRNFFDKPDGKNDTHTWIRKCLREQTQIDELYWYKHRTRGNKLLGLWVVAGDQVKPLLDDWGMQPDPPNFAYQQYPWGIPGMQYRSDQMIHYQETPATDTPYGFSRVERVILEVNQGLRKKKKDLAHFTEGNIPQSFMEVPETPNWTPDQIDAFSQSFNAMIAGNAQQQVRMMFLQPGMKYIPAEQYQLLSDFDKYILNIAVACYGMSMAELSFTEDVNRSSGESQEDMVYRRTIGPNAVTYGEKLTDIVNNDFPPEMHGEMFEVTFGGYEEVEDEGKKATANTTYTGAGVLGLTDAAKLGNLPIDPGAPVIGRVLPTPNGPIFLDDAEFMDAWRTAQMAGFQMAANPPEPNAQNPGGDKSGDTPPGQKAEKQPPKDETPEQDSKKTLARVTDVLARVEEHLWQLRTHTLIQEEYEQGTQQDQEEQAQRDGDPRGEASDTTTRRTEASHSPHDGSGGDSAKAVSQEYRKWRLRALDDIKAGKAQRGFTTTLIPQHIHTYISGELARCTSADGVRALFKRVQDGPVPHWQDDYPAIGKKLEALDEAGVETLTWKARPGACDNCMPNDGQTVRVGQKFKSGARIPPEHGNCGCDYIDDKGRVWTWTGVDGEYKQVQEG